MTIRDYTIRSLEAKGIFLSLSRSLKKEIILSFVSLKPSQLITFIFLAKLLHVVHHPTTDMARHPAHHRKECEIS